MALLMPHEDAARATIPENPDDLMTRPEVARALRVSLRTLARLIGAGDFPEPLMMRGPHRWRAGDVRQYVYEHQKQKPLFP